MPIPNDGETEKDFVARCIPIVLEDGTAADQEQAAAICYSKFREKDKKGVEATKVGARHSSADQRALQDIHDAIIRLGAACPQPRGEVYEYALMSAPEDLVASGGEVKALGDGKVAGYLVRFTTADDPDLTGDYFTKDTDFGDADHTDVYYHHGADKTIGKRKLGKGTLQVDDVGVWIEAQLNLRDEYERAVYALAEKNKLGWSSGSAGHLVEKRNTGKASVITAWPLGLDASLTPTPAEPRNSAIIQMKAIDPVDATLMLLTERVEALTVLVAASQVKDEPNPTGRTDNQDRPTGTAG